MQLHWDPLNQCWQLPRNLPRIPAQVPTQIPAYDEQGDGQGRGRDRRRRRHRGARGGDREHAPHQQNRKSTPPYAMHITKSTKMSQIKSQCPMMTGPKSRLPAISVGLAVEVPNNSRREFKPHRRQRRYRRRIRLLARVATTSSGK